MRIALGVLAAHLLVSAQAAGVTVSERDLTIQEGATGSYTAVLNTQPTETVTIGVSASDDSTRCLSTSGASCTRKSGVATVDKSSLTFTTTNWNQAQTVTATNEDMSSVFKFAKVTHSVSGGNYGTVTAREVRVTVRDTDTRRVFFHPPETDGTPTPQLSHMRVTEGDSAHYYAALSTEPTENTTLTFANPNPDQVRELNAASLTFTPTNWDWA